MVKFRISPSASVASNSVLGQSLRPLLGSSRVAAEGSVEIGASVYVGNYCVIGCDVHIGDKTIVDDYSKLEPGVRVGQRNLIIYGAQVCCDVVCGDDNIIGGFIGEATKIANNCRIFGRIVHKQDDPAKPWDDEGSAEGAPEISSNCFIGFGATIVGELTLSPHVYITAGAVVTKSVPPRTIVVGVNHHIPVAEWKGSLRNSDFFER